MNELPKGLSQPERFVHSAQQEATAVAQLGYFLRKYAGQPDSVDIQQRSTIREDSVINELTSMMNGLDDINVLDACCGSASLARRLLSSNREVVKRINYWAIDRDYGCIDNLNEEAETFAQFRSFRAKLRPIEDLSGIPQNTFDIIVLNNALHEIPPVQFPLLFEVFNALLNPSRGRICIVDMEELPNDAPESIAINWTKTEIESILKSARLPHAVTYHEKSVPVYRARVEYAPNGVDQDSMKDEITRLMIRKLRHAVKQRRKIKVSDQCSVADLRQWLIVTGTIARLADELCLMEALE